MQKYIQICQDALQRVLHDPFASFRHLGNLKQLSSFRFSDTGTYKIGAMRDASEEWFVLNFFITIILNLLSCFSGGFHVMTAMIVLVGWVFSSAITLGIRFLALWILHQVDEWPAMVRTGLLVLCGIFCLVQSVSLMHFVLSFAQLTWLSSWSIPSILIDVWNVASSLVCAGLLLGMTPSVLDISE